MTIPKKAFSKVNSAEPISSQIEDVEICAHDFCQIFEPIKDILDNDVVYANYETGLHHYAHELRQMCVEVHTIQTIDDKGRRAERNTLVNALQGIIESIEDAHGDIIVFNSKDIAALSENTNIIRENAITYREFVHKPDVATSLENIADNIDNAQCLKYNLERTLTFFDDSLGYLAA